MRSFSDTEATRSHVPVLCALYGPSGSGKTYSALRLATGIARVDPGPIFVIDTESRRSLHYADAFDFRHVNFTAPFGPLDYLAAIEHCVKQGAKTIVIDSLSHEHEGPGGVLEMHDKEMGGNFSKSMIAWAKPKGERRRLINSIMQLPVNLVLCFRAKDKIKPAPRGSDNKEPIPQGWMPIGGEEFVYEMTMAALLTPGCDGVPDWRPEHRASREMVKLPLQFRDLLAGEQLTENIGESMARWASGAPPGPYKIPKGPHKGKELADVPTDYLATLKASDAVTGKLRELVDAEIDGRQEHDAPADDSGELTEEAAMGGE